MPWKATFLVIFSLTRQNGSGQILDKKGVCPWSLGHGKVCTTIFFCSRSIKLPDFIKCFYVFRHESDGAHNNSCPLRTGPDQSRLRLMDQSSARGRHGFDSTNTSPDHQGSAAPLRLPPLFFYIPAGRGRRRAQFVLAIHVRRIKVSFSENALSLRYIYGVHPSRNQAIKGGKTIDRFYLCIDIYFLISVCANKRAGAVVVEYCG